MDGSGDSSSPSKKTSMSEQQLSATVPPTALTPSGDKSESSEIREDISLVPSDVTSRSELHLKLHDIANDDVSDGGIRSDLVAPHDLVTPRFDDHTTPRSVASDARVASNSARSLSEIAEEYSASIHTEMSSRGKMSHPQTPTSPEPARHTKSVEKSTQLEVSQTKAERSNEVVDKGTSESSSATLTEESRSERSERSDHSAASKTTTYSQDFSSEGSKSGQWTRTEEHYRDEDSIQTEEDISEDLSVESDTDDLPDRLHLKTGDTPAHMEVMEGVLAHLVEGRRVMVGGIKSGVLRFKGVVQFAPGVWAGVELDEAEGTNDGTKDGVTYFSCQPGHGLFVPPDKITDHPSDVHQSVDTTCTHDNVASDASKHSFPDEESQEKTLDTHPPTIDTQTPPIDMQTPPIDTQTPPIELVDDEPTVDEVSIATVDSELDRVINSADAGVLAFDSLDSLDMSAEVERVLQQDSTIDQTPEGARLQVVPDTDVIAHSLLTEAISEILNIRRQKHDLQTPCVVTVQEDSPMLVQSLVRERDDTDRLISPIAPLGHTTSEDVHNKQVSVYVIVQQLWLGGMH